MKYFQRHEVKEVLNAKKLLLEHDKEEIEEYLKAKKNRYKIPNKKRVTCHEIIDEWGFTLYENISKLCTLYLHPVILQEFAVKKLLELRKNKFKRFEDEFKEEYEKSPEALEAYIDYCVNYGGDENKIIYEAMLKVMKMIEKGEGWTDPDGAKDYMEEYYE